MANAIRGMLVCGLRLFASLVFFLVVPAFADEPAAPPPPSADDPVPYIGESGQEKYREYLRKPVPKAFAISPSGGFAVAAGSNARFPRRPNDPKLRALELCREASGGADCVLYSVDNQVVFGKSAATASFNPAGPSALPGAPPPAGMEPPPVTPPPHGAPAAASPAPVRTRFVGNVELDHQFNPIATVTYADGSTSTLGDALFGLNAGAAHPLTSDGRFEIQGLVGVSLGRINASNGSATFWDFPVEITAHWNAGPVRVGAGPALHIAPMLRGSGFAAGGDVNFDTTVGAVVRVEYQFNRKFGLGLHGSWLRLSANGVSEDASRIGGVFSLYL